jgi:glycosyltransferase involved in cell wall biosynthesis
LIVTNSYGTALKLKMYYNKETDIVIHPILDSWYKVIDPAIVKTKLNELGINYPYILTVATQEPRKNLDKTINAFINVKKDSGLSAFKLLLIGSKGWKSEKVEELMQLHSQDVFKLGYIDDDMMPYLYNGAHLFVFPSSYEGFGMPAKEAMLCGLPVITSDITELREATSNNAVYIDPFDQKAFEKAISAAIKKPKSATLLIPDKPADQLDKFVPAIVNLKNAF